MHPLPEAVHSRSEIFIRTFIAKKSIGKIIRVALACPHSNNTNATEHNAAADNTAFTPDAALALGVEGAVPNCGKEIEAVHSFWLDRVP
jgi:hypothetical protein